MNVKNKHLTKIHLFRLIKSFIILQVIAIVPLLFTREYLSFFIITEFATFITLPSYICDLWRKCPVCGKRTLTRVARCAGERYTLYDGECRTCGTEVDITEDRDEKKLIYHNKDIYIVTKK